MNVSGAMNQAGVQTSAISARQVASLKRGLLTIKSASVTPEVAPGGVVELQLTVENSASIILETDPDNCVNPANPCAAINNSYCYNVVATPEWTQPRETSPQCLEAAALGTFTREHHFEFVAPQDTGTFTFDLTLVTPGSGAADTQRFVVSVTEGGGQRPGPGCRTDADCPGGQVCQGGTCVTAEDDVASDIERVAFALAVLIGLAIISGVMT